MNTQLLSATIVILLVGIGLTVWYVVRRGRARRQTVLAQVEEALLSGEYRAAADAALAALGGAEDATVRFALRTKLARALAGTEEYAAARRVCEEAAATAASPAERGEAFVELARTFAAAGDFDEACDALGRAADLPLTPDGRLRRDLVAADVALVRYRFDEAERALAGAFGPPGQGGLADEAALGHARLQYLRGNFHQAIAEINRLVDRANCEDLQALALFTLARALLDQERPVPVEADQAVSSALVLARYPGLAAIATACSAVVQAHFGNDIEALEAAERAPKMTVSKRYAAEAHCLSGDALRRMNRFTDARTHYQTALGLDSGCLDALWGLGTCAQMLGLYEVAESYFHLCMEAAPEHFLGRRSEDAIET